MANYIIAYHAGKTAKNPGEPEERARHMAKWQAWLEEIGDAMVNSGTPLGKSKFISSSGETRDGEAGALTGYSIVKAHDMDAALEIAGKCPFLEIGTLEVAQIMEMN